MYQKSCLRHNVVIKDNFCYKPLPIHNRTHEEIQKYMFIFLLMTSVQIFYGGVFSDQTGIEIFCFLKLFAREDFPCFVGFSMVIMQ